MSDRASVACSWVCPQQPSVGMSRQPDSLAGMDALQEFARTYAQCIRLACTLTYDHNKVVGDAWMASLSLLVSSQKLGWHMRL
jgi:hypothetical protein